MNDNQSVNGNGGTPMGGSALLLDRLQPWGSPMVVATLVWVLDSCLAWRWLPDLSLTGALVLKVPLDNAYARILMTGTALIATWLLRERSGTSGAHTGVPSDSRWFGAAFKVLDFPIVAGDAQGRLIYMNPAAQAILGRELFDLIGEPLATVLEFGRPSHVSAHPVATALRQGCRIELGNGLLLRRNAGRSLAVCGTVLPIGSPPGKDGVLVWFYPLYEGQGTPLPVDNRRGEVPWEAPPEVGPRKEDAKAAGDSPLKEKWGAEGGHASGEGPVIVVLEDEAMVLSLISRILRRNGFQVIEGEDGQEGVTICQEFDGPIDMLLTDLIMPKMGGHEVATVFRRERPETRIMFCTGYSETAEMSGWLKDLDIALLNKPFTAGELMTCVRQVLSHGAVGPGSEPVSTPDP